jgi:hypothetical protein
LAKAGGIAASTHHMSNRPHRVIILFIEPPGFGFGLSAKGIRAAVKASTVPGAFAAPRQQGSGT